MKKEERIALAVLIIWPIIGAAISLFAKVNSLQSIVIFFIVPSIMISVWAKEHIKKCLIFAAIASLPAMIIVDYIASITQAWYVSTVFPFKLFNVIVMEDLIWVFSSFYFTIMFYEYFLNKHVTKKLWNPHMKYLIGIIIAMFAVFATAMMLNPNILKIPYFYMVFGIPIILIPVAFEVFKYPSAATKILKAGIYFIFLNFMHEIIGLKLGWWSFPGIEYVSMVKVLGFTFPIEELVFFVLFYQIAILSYYEYFDDDEK